ncbi:protein adenylyltransferase SelO family protein, partial [Akkermansiaceae bacterium]|nr:protein adenylyltransferase SelO family protein [Akkermansiaceae bacterium]
GSGRTPFSRGGDGKSALGPVLREYLVSEAMHALGIPSTRALAAVSTGEAVYRQEGPVPGGVFTRVASSHIRVGTFQYFYARQDHEAVKILADYVIKRHYPQASSALELLDAAISAQASLIAQWMSVGFIHGVMNTDNCAISGETIDFGPCAFIDKFHPNCVFSSIDRNARYAWGNQPSMAHWNLTRFAETLLPVIDSDQDVAISVAEESLKKFAPQFQEHYLTRFREKLALPADSDPKFVDATLDLLATQQIDFTLFFRWLTQVAAGADPAELASLFEDPTPFHEWLGKWQAISKPSELLAQMRGANPIRIPRNHRVEQAIQAAYQADFTLFTRLAEAWVKPFEEDDSLSDLETAPLPDEVVQETFCGT